MSSSSSDSTRTQTTQETFAQLKRTCQIAWEMSRTEHRRVVTAYGLAMFTEGMTIVTPWVTAELSLEATHVLREATISGRGKALLGSLLLSWAVWNGLSIVRDKIASELDINVSYVLRTNAVAQILRLSRRYHTNHNAAEQTSRITRGVESLTRLLMLFQFNLLPVVTMIVIGLIIMFWTHVLLGAAGLVVLLIHVIVMAKGRRTIAPLRRERQKNKAAFDAYVGEITANVLTIQAYGNEQAVMNAIREKCDHVKRLAAKQADLRLKNWAAREFVGDGIYWGVIVGTFALTIDGSLSVATFVFLLTIALRYREQIAHFGWMYDAFIEMMGDVEELYDLSQETPDIGTPESPTPLPRTPAADIRIERVSFSYPSSGPQGKSHLSDITLTIAAGNVLGITGPSGGGKSTLVSLLLRFDDPTHGTISVNGVDLRLLSRSDYASCVGYVEQDVRLFNDTVTANIAFHRDATEEEIVAAAKMAGAHDFIMKLPEGYATSVGDRAVRLSGGQRARIGLARALLSKPSLLILDEATAAIDPESIEEIMRSLERIKGTCTIVAVSHQLSTLQRLADHIAIIRDGRVAEYGSHDDLLAHGEFYKKVVSIQQEEGRRARRMDTHCQVD